jgi:hypothetical protein
MGPQAYDFDGFLFFENLINQTVLDIDPSGKKSL